MYSVAHASDLLFHLVFLGIFSEILLSPAREYDALITWRDLLLIIYATASLSRHRPLATRLAQWLILISYLITIPTQPVQGMPSHYPLLFSFCWSLLLFLFPRGPTPILLFPLQLVLPSAVDFSSMLVPLIVRPLVYFLPLTFVALSLLSLSMDDPWSNLAAGIDTYITPNYVITPYPTRQAFSLLFCIIFLLAISFSIHSLIRHASRPPGHLSDRYDIIASTIPLSVDETRVSHRAVLTYARRYPFPPPLNLACLILVTIPRAVVRIVTGKLQRDDGTEWLGRVEAILWGVLVLPCDIVVAGLWGWSSGKRETQSSQS